MPKNKNKTQLQNLDVTEVSFCNKGMNPGAKIALFKKGEVAKLRDFSDIIDSDQQRKREAMRNFEIALRILEEAVGSAAFDFEATPEDRQASIQMSIEQFGIHVSTMPEPLSKKRGVETMKKKDFEKLLKDLDASDKVKELMTKQNDELEAVIEKAKDTDAKMKEADKKAEAKIVEAKKIEAAKAITDPIEKAKAEGASETVLNILKDNIEKQKEADAKQKVSDEKISKMQEDQKKEACLAKALKFSKIGKADELAELLYSVSKGEDVSEKLETLFGRLNKAVSEGDLFKELGKTGEGDAESADLLKMKKAYAEINKDGKSREQVIDEVYQASPELYEANIDLTQVR